MPKTLSRAERRHRQAITRASRMGGALARLIRAARIACCEALPETIGPHDLIRVRQHVEAATGHLQRVAAFRFRAMLLQAAEREHYLSAVEFTRISRRGKVEEGWRDYLKLIIPSPALDFLERIVGPLWRRVVGTISPQRASDAVLQGIAGGKDRRQIAADLEEVFGGYESAARRVARTAGLQVATQTQLAVSETIPDLVAGYELNTVLDERVRPEHRAAHGRKFYRVPKAGQRGLDQCPQPPIWNGEVAWNCILPDQMVSGRFRRGFKARYSGKAYEVLTASGASLRVTANHPILTPQGFVPAHSLRKGDRVIGHMPNVNRLADGEHDRPTTAEKLYRSLSEVAGSVTVSPLPLDFDGDAERFNGDVDVTPFVGELSHRVIAGRNQGVTDGDFTFANKLQGALPSDRPFVSDFKGILLPPSGGVGLLDLSPSLAGRHRRPLDLLRLGLASEVDTVADHESRQTKPHALARLEPATGNTEFVGELLERHPGLVAADDVVSVREFEWSGHVYDFETDVGYFAAGGDGELYAPKPMLWVGNCRCFLVPIIEIDGEEI